jgi:DNA-binding Lrp family transcriptional regulator
MIDNTKLLKILENDCMLTSDQIAAMLGEEPSAIADAIKELERNNIILGYKAIIDWDRTDEETVTALIEVKVTPQRGRGFERVAERIYQYEEVENLYLMSGGYDLSVLIAGKTMKEVALFVATKLAPIEGVSGTATHFILKKYKDNGIMFKIEEEQQEKAFLL